MIYEAIGRFVVRYVWRRYRTQVKIGAGVALLSLLAAGYLAGSRDAPEG